MPNVALVLKQEIARLSRREARAVARPLRKLTAQHRRDGAALKRRLKALESRLLQLAGAVEKLGKNLESQGGAAAVELGEKWRKDTVRSTRRRLKLTQGAFAKLLGVSLGSVNGWETGRAQPRAAQQAAILALRNGEGVSAPDNSKKRSKPRRRAAKRRGTAAR